MTRPRPEQILWFDEHDLTRRLLELRPEWQQLVDEVSFLIRRRLDQAHLEVASISGRVKTLPSVLEKLKRKHYRVPLAEMTDLAGVRVVCLHPADFTRVGEVLARTFDIVEEVSKEADREDAFGYQARHYVVKLRHEVSGERCALLGHHRCEIQVRTVLQDAWAIIDHHLRYKTEDEVPKRLRRDLYALAAVLENADSQFEMISRERARYLKRLASPRLSLKSLLKEETNRESLAVYLRKRFPSLRLAASESHLDFALAALDFERFPLLADVEQVMAETAEVRRGYRDRYYKRTAAAHLALAMACVDTRYRRKTQLGEEARAVVRAFEEKNRGRRRKAV